MKKTHFKKKKHKKKMKSSNLSLAQKRLINDLKQFNNDDDTVLASPKEDNIMEWECVIFGPEDTIWDGGCFKLIMKFPSDYPNKAPEVKMMSKVFHPNFYNDGRICLDILQDQWSPIYDVKSILTSIQSLLTDPNPSSPANAEAAKLYNSNIQEYNKRVKDCVEASMKDDE
jgi:ubiquitin-conjugating enzyme E2 A